MNVYADNAATTKMSPAAIQAMTASFETLYGNPSSLYSIGQQAAEALAEARETMAAGLGCQPSEIVFTSGVPITMAGLDVTEKALILPEDFERVRALGNPVSDIVAQWLEFFYKFHRSIGYAGAPMHDPCAVMALIHPEIFTIRPMYVQVETGGEYCRGTTVGDLLGFSGHAPNADVLMDVDRSRFADLLVEAIGFYGEAKA